VHEVVHARGHEHVSAAHTSTFEVTTDDWLTPAGDWILAVDADRVPADFDDAFVDACRDPAATITATLTATTDDGAIEVEIADDGGGIPPDVREHLFEPGVHGSDSSGDGIGLYLVGKLVDAYGGRVAVSERSPSGTRFSFRFPPASSDADRFR